MVTLQLVPDTTHPPGPAASAVVFDVLRATTTIVTAMASGALAVHPVGEVQKARHLAARLGDALLGGERKFQPPPGFDLGNSPLQYTRAQVFQKTLVLCTSNGTAALHSARGAHALLVGSLLNAKATAAALPEGRDVVLVCAGTLGAPAVEDLLGAGAVAEHLRRRGAALAPLALAAADLFDTVGDMEAFLLRTPNGRRLSAAGFEPDVRMAAKLDLFPLVVGWADGALRQLGHPPT